MAERNNTFTYGVGSFGNVTDNVLGYTPENRTNDTANLTTTPAVEGALPPSPHDLWLQIIICIILITMIVGTLIGNSLVCIAVALVKRLRNPSNFLIVSLAVSDLLVALLVMPLALMVEIQHSWGLGDVICDLWTSLDVLLCTASILNLCAISVDRYLVITRPFQYAMKRTPRRMALMITFVWLFSAGISIPPVFGWKEPRRKNDCMISQQIGYQIYATLCAFYLPLAVMIFVYFKIWRVSSRIAKAEASSKMGTIDGRPPDERQNSKISQNSGDSTLAVHFPNGTVRNNSSVDDPSLEMLPRRADHNRRRFTIRSLLPKGHRASASKERKATKTLGIIMGGFTICWLPFFILAVIRPFCGHNEEHCSLPPWLSSIFLWLGYANSFLNPVIYARFNRDFRTPFKEILCFRCRGINIRLRSESYAEQYGGGPGLSHRESLKPPTETIARYNSQGQTVVQLGNGSTGANGNNESKI